MRFIEKPIGVAQKLMFLCAVSVVLASCASNQPKVAIIKKAKSKEYFAESLVGVKASPRVINVALASPGGKMKRLPRGGGREMVGKPYKVRGKWYHPREIDNYSAKGTASWYGDAFHGRLTANGEIYDMNHLSAAHPTMPLPSYARVTNLKNGKSVIVRINDRGPYAHNRMIDLSKRAAQLLDYTNSGTAQVQMDYIGRAPVHGKDDEYLLASYQDGGANGAGVMLAMNETARPAAALAEANVGSTVSFAPASEQPQPVAPGVQSTPDLMAQDGFVLEDSGMRGALPAVAPVLVDKPEVCVTLEPCTNAGSETLLSGYAPAVSKSQNPFALFDKTTHNSDPVNATTNTEKILLGSYSTEQAKQLRTTLHHLAKLTFEMSDGSSVEVFARPVAGMTMDTLVRKLWDKGFAEAFVVR